jgi:hypothetical protein
MRLPAIVALLLGCSSPDPAETALQKPGGACPPGTQLEGDVCRPRVVLDCPPGTQFREGVGCVATVIEPTATPVTTGTSAPIEEPATPPSSTTSPAELGPCGCKPDDTVCIMQCGPRAPPLSTASRTGEFDRFAAADALKGAARAAQVCRRIPGPTGPGTVIVVFEPRGTVKSATVSEPYRGTPAGDCVEKLFLQTTVPAFRGETVSISKTFQID